MNYETLAGKIMFGSVKTSSDLDECIEGHFEYRKNKGLKDVKHALQKAYKQNTFKAEQEERWFALYLKDVFKEASLLSKLTLLAKGLTGEKSSTFSDIEHFLSIYGLEFRPRKSAYNVYKSIENKEEEYFATTEKQMNLEIKREVIIEVLMDSIKKK